MPYFITSLDQVDEKYHDLYTQVDGGYRLKVEGVVPKEKVDEFRTNNIELKRQLEQAQAEAAQAADRFKDIDPAKYQEALQKLNELEGKKLMDDGKMQEYLEHQTKSMKEQYEQQVSAMQQARDQAQQRSGTLLEELSSLKIDTAVQTHVNNVGTPKKGAIQDILLRARQDWTIDDEGNVKPKATKLDSEGNKISSIQDWARDLLNTAGYLFGEAKGGGSAGSQRDGGGNQRSISNDPVSVGQNLEAVAGGKIRVDPGN